MDINVKLLIRSLASRVQQHENTSYNHQHYVAISRTKYAQNLTTEFKLIYYN